eukprot:gnl/Spiro4/12765_TR6765_c0_g1_i1.p1 gnl/Spiro4/12765_TR6765_c0_g1~~gnl/Spiro4/12765_TR6765_c0_g1_i1.p1  ORF type:complete len:355 (+),score=72.35 gnl/Spiro4/12765_TR6765_c0_g1_i1:131-1195(+)
MSDDDEEHKKPVPFRMRPTMLQAPEVLPPRFVDFLTENGISPEAYHFHLRVGEQFRFIRLNPRNPVSVEELTAEFGVVPDPVPWLPGFFRLPATTQIASSRSYRSGQIYGMDASSGAAVEILAPTESDSVLDLCCAPGAKLAMIADRMKNRGRVVGVDVSSPRLAACRTIVDKYGITNVTLHLADGCTFSDHNAEAPERPAELFSKVLVDAECTHDGSLKHITKFSQWGWESFEKRVLDPARIPALAALQRRLLRNGFANLQPGGRLVYSTCSLTRAQNEDVVSDLLASDPTSYLIPVEPAATGATLPFPARASDLLAGTLRFDPLALAGTSGLFVACISKRELPNSTVEPPSS